MHYQVTLVGFDTVVKYLGDVPVPRPAGEPGKTASQLEAGDKILLKPFDDEVTVETFEEVEEV